MLKQPLPEKTLGEVELTGQEPAWKTKTSEEDDGGFALRKGRATKYFDEAGAGEEVGDRSANVSKDVQSSKGDADEDAEGGFGI